MIGCLPTQALAFLAVFVYATHATQAIAFEWKPGFSLRNKMQLALDLPCIRPVLRLTINQLRRPREQNNRKLRQQRQLTLRNRATHMEMND